MDADDCWARPAHEAGCTTCAISDLAGGAHKSATAAVTASTGVRSKECSLPARSAAVKQYRVETLIGQPVGRGASGLTGSRIRRLDDREGWPHSRRCLSSRWTKPAFRTAAKCRSRRPSATGRGDGHGDESKRRGIVRPDKRSRLQISSRNEFRPEPYIACRRL